MKKWFDYQCKNISDTSTWAQTYEPLATLSDTLIDEFDIIKVWYYQNIDNIDVGINIAKPLVGHAKYIDQIKDAYDDEFVKTNIKSWCRDPKYLRLIDAPSYDQVVINAYFQDFCHRLCREIGAGFEGSQINLQVQRPGYISPLHIDSRKKLDLNSTSKFNPNQAPDHRRWIFFLDDWKLGQVFQMGEAFLKWKKGEVFSWSVKDVPHALANLGYEDRFLILVKAEVIVDNQ